MLSHQQDGTEIFYYGLEHMIIIIPQNYQAILILLQASISHQMPDFWQGMRITIIKKKKKLVQDKKMG